MSAPAAAQWQDPCAAAWLPYCGIMAKPPGTGGRIVGVTRRGQLFEETGLADDLDWHGVQEWRLRDDLR